MPTQEAMTGQMNDLAAAFLRVHKVDAACAFALQQAAIALAKSSAAAEEARLLSLFATSC